MNQTSGTQAISLRRMTADDESFLFELYASTREEELAPVPWTEEKKRQFLRMQFDAQLVAYTNNYPGAALDIILVDGEAAGRLFVYRSSIEIRIIDIALVSKWRRQGIGARLLTTLADESEQSGVPLTIHVEKNNPALHLYERFGFRAAEDKSFYWFMQRMPLRQLNTAS